MAKESKTKYVLLGLLRHENLSGYEMKQLIQRRLSYFWNESFGQIYPQLAGLLSGGYIKKCKNTTGRSDKDVYEITSKGRKMLSNWLEIPADTEMIRFESLLKIFFGAQSGPRITCTHLQRFRSKYETQLSLMNTSIDALTSGLNASDDHRYFYLLALLGKMTAETYIKWSHEAESHLTKLKASSKGW